MNDKYLKTLEHAELYNVIFSFIGVIGLPVFCMLPIVFISIELIGRYTVVIVIFLVVMIGIIVKWYIKKLNKYPEYIDELTLKVNVDVIDMEIKYTSSSGAIYYFWGDHTFTRDEIEDKTYEKFMFECCFNDGSNVLIEYIRSIKQKGIYPQMEVYINPSNYNQYFIDSKDYMRKLAIVLN